MLYSHCRISDPTYTISHYLLTYLPTLRLLYNSFTVGVLPQFYTASGSTYAYWYILYEKDMQVMFHQVVTGPPAVAVNIRAGWSMKGVQDTYVRSNS